MFQKNKFFSLVCFFLLSTCLLTKEANMLDNTDVETVFETIKSDEHESLEFKSEENQENKNRNELLAEDEDESWKEEEEEEKKTKKKLKKTKTTKARNRSNWRKNRKSKSKKKNNGGKKDIPSPFGDLNFDHLMDKMKDFDFSNMKMPENMDMEKMKDMAKDFGVDENLFDNINMDDVQNAMKNGNFNMDDMKKQYDQYFTKQEESKVEL